MATSNNSRGLIDTCIAEAGDRFDFWVNFINRNAVQCALEVGVFKGDFAEKILRNCASVRKYYMLDPWRNLDGWDKPANADNHSLETLMQETLEKTEFAGDRRVVLRGKTTEIIDRIPDGSLDWAYIDGDHTLKGITIDLMRVYPKVRSGGFIGGDDFIPDILQHFPHFEPSLVFPFAIYFAEAVSARIYNLPHKQFLIEKTGNSTFDLIDIAGTASDTSIKGHILRTLRQLSGKPS